MGFTLWAVLWIAAIGFLLWVMSSGQSMEPEYVESIEENKDGNEITN